MLARGQNVPTIEQAADFVERRRPEVATLLISRSVLLGSADNFLKSFPGGTLYAVKANPHPEVLACLGASEIAGFDVASIEEAESVRTVCSSKPLHYSHPVKATASIRDAYKIGIRHYVVDSEVELDKILACVSRPLSIAVRLKTPEKSGTYDFNTKFGLHPAESVPLIKRIIDAKVEWGLTFHVGSQCKHPKAFSAAIHVCHSVIENLGKMPGYLNVGGGFPVAYGQERSDLTAYFVEIKAACSRMPRVPLLCEPGRALVAESGTLVVQVIGRADDRVFLSDGVFGSFGEVNYSKIQMTPYHLTRASAVPSLAESEFRVFGPTCDSFDELDQRLLLPATIKEGDWLIFPMMGAYSNALASRFNGFRLPSVELID
ncbi:hypothetical protein [Acidiphilium sp. JA12-A1]|uniref:hypothetical protein n=1 Tax=Acidiphilium sp. JA12-A1 TaxID=1464546 RepID=UPI0004614D48|nr:hypothetical protein [Acidiphilium sp. JA12-A1]KDM66230.1 lysine/ornithine decarboxylase Ldc [Acidiphilium sp. JA12-A1]